MAKGFVTTATDDGDKFAWKSKEQKLGSDGAVVQSRVTYDDGRTVLSTFDSDGKMTSRTVTDGGNNRQFVTYTDKFDDDGNLISRVKLMDNGLVMTSVYSDGELVSRNSIDVFDQFVWSRKTQVNGELTPTEYSRVDTLEYDNGQILQRFYRNDLPDLAVQLDVTDAFRWEYQQTQYDDAGQREDRLRIFDDGGIAFYSLDPDVIV